MEAMMTSALIARATSGVAEYREGTRVVLVFGRHDEQRLTLVGLQLALGVVDLAP